LGDLLLEFVDGLLDMRDIVREFSFCAMVSEELHFVEANLGNFWRRM
jgi:hypothetical protein